MITTLQQETQFIEKAKDLVKFFILNFMQSEKSFKQTLSYNRKRLIIECQHGSRGVQYYLELQAVESAMFIPGQFKEAIRSLMSFRFYKPEEGVLFIGHGEWSETLKALEDFVLRQASVIGPVLEVIDKVTQNATEELQIANVSGMDFVGDVEYTKPHGYTLLLMYKPDIASTKSELYVNLRTPDKFRDQLPPAVTKGELKELSERIYLWSNDILSKEVTDV